MKNHSRTLSLVFFTLLALSTQCGSAGTFTNGSFELPGGVPPGSFVGLAPGNTSLTGWTVAGDGIGLHNGMKLPQLDFLPVDGNYALVFNGGLGHAGDLIAQAFDTIPGVDYEVTFYVGRMGGGPGEVSITASVTSSNGQPLGRLIAFPPSHGYGNRQQLVFAATTEMTTLFLTDTSKATNAVDVVLDNVAVSPLQPQTTIQVSQVNVCWDSLTNRIYQVEQRSDLTTNIWTNLGSPVIGTGGTICITDLVGAEPRRFYRVVKLP